MSEHWDLIAEWINKGWPVICDRRNIEGHWYGLIIDRFGGLWVYRLYAAGKDRFGREGRYFFVLIQIKSRKAIHHPLVAALLRYFETERNLPLNTEPLEAGLEMGEPDELLALLDRQTPLNPGVGHWGIDEDRKIIRLYDGLPQPLLASQESLKILERSPPVEPRRDLTRLPRKWTSALCWALGSTVIGVVVLTALFELWNPTLQRIQDLFSGFQTGSTSDPAGTMPNPRPIPENMEPAHPDRLQNAADETSPSNNTPKPSLPPPTDSPAIQSKP